MAGPVIVPFCSAYLMIYARVFQCRRSVILSGFLGSLKIGGCRPDRVSMALRNLISCVVNGDMHLSQNPSIFTKARRCWTVEQLRFSIMNLKKSKCLCSSS